MVAAYVAHWKPALLPACALCGFTGPCPALQWSEAGSRYHCGMLTTPEKYLGWIGAAGRILIKRAISRWIAAGKGCDCSADVQP